MGWFTQFGWPDNTPAGSAGINNGGTNGLSYPHNSNNGIHGGNANGAGTYQNPITMAGSTSIIPAGMEIYSPRRGKYYILEDSCTECTQDLQGRGRVQDPDYPASGNYIQAEGPNGGPNLVHFDQWIDGRGSLDWPDILICEDALTLGDDEGPVMEPFVVNPGPDEWYNIFPVYFEGDPKKYTDPANADLDDRTPHCGYEERPDGHGNIVASETPMDENIIVGPIVSYVSGQCLTSPGNSKDVGTRVAMADCDGSASQNFTFSGLFLMINNLCVDMGNGRGGNGSTTNLSLTWNDPETGAPMPVNGSGVQTPWSVTARNATLQKCNMNARQQWEMSYDGTISDIQDTGNALADGLDGFAYFTGSMSNPRQVNIWSWPWGGDQNARLGVTINPMTGLKPGSEITVTVTGLSTPVASIWLLSEDGGQRYPLADYVLANADGSIETIVTLPAVIPTGNYSIFVQGDYLVYPDGHVWEGMPGYPPLQSNGVSTGILTGDTSVSGTSVANFRFVDRTASMFGQSTDFFIPMQDPGGQNEPVGPGGHGFDTGGSVVPNTALPFGIAGLVLLSLGLGAILIRRRPELVG